MNLEKVILISAVSIIMGILLNCSNAKFSSEGERKSADQPLSSQQPTQQQQDNFETQAGPPEALPPIPKIDYQGCRSQAKRGYGKCDANEAIVIVNDGKSQEMTCCRFGTTEVFSFNQAELFVSRQGSCQVGEVATGMSNPNGGYYCSKLSKYFTTGNPLPAKYIRSAGSADPELQAIAASYNVNDTCICGTNTVMFGGKTARDNRCTDKCVEIISFNP